MSVGKAKEMLVAMFANSLITISTEPKVQDDPEVLARDSNKDYHLNKRVDRRLQKLKEDIRVTVHDCVSPSEARWLKTNNSKRTGKALMAINEDVASLELLAVWIMYNNFSEMNSKISKDFQLFMDYDYLEIAEMLGKTDAESVEASMFNVSTEIIDILKG